MGLSMVHLGKVLQLERQSAGIHCHGTEKNKVIGCVPLIGLINQKKKKQINYSNHKRAIEHIKLMVL